MEVAWSEKCDALAAAAAETSTAVTVLLFVLAVALVLFASRHVAAHPPRPARDAGRRGAPARVGTAEGGGKARAAPRAVGSRSRLARGDAESGSRLMGEDERNAPRWRGNGDVRARARARRASRRRLRRRVYGRAGGRFAAGVPATTHLWRLVFRGRLRRGGQSVLSGVRRQHGAVVGPDSGLRRARAGVPAGRARHVHSARRARRVRRRRRRRRYVPRRVSPD